MYACRLFRNDHLHGTMVRGMSSNSHHEQTSNLLSRDFKILVLRICICLDLPDYCRKVSWNISFLNIKNLLMDDFLAYLADTVESHFIKTDLNGTVLGTIALTAYK